MDIVQALCQEFHLKTQQCENVLRLIDDGNTIPFIARYRKEQTGSLDDQLLREIYERLQYLRGLDKRRGEIAAALEEQGNLTDELSDRLQKAATLTELEDLYRPFRPKRRTRATVAREKGLEPLALALLMQNETKGTAQELARPYVNPEKGVETAEDALQGARDILAEQMSDDADVRKSLRALAMRTGVLESKNTGEEDSVYATYYDFSQEARNLPAHRVLAMNRGEREGFLKVSLRLNGDDCVGVVEKAFVRPGGRVGPPASAQHRAGDPRRSDRTRQRQRHSGVRQKPAPAAHGPSGQGPRHAGRGPRLPHGLQAGRGG